MLLKFVKTRDVNSPNRGHATDAGIDFRCPKFDKEFLDDFKANKSNEGAYFENGKLVIPPGYNAVIPSGIKIEVPYGYMGIFLNKSGIASKHDALIGAQVIDTFYDGEVHIDIHNVGKEFIEIDENMKLAQLVMVPVLSCDLTEIEEDQLYDWMKQDIFRGSNGFGSTGK